MNLKITITMFLALVLGASTLYSQEPAPKYGHMNLGNLLEELPATKTANAALKTVGDSLTVIGDSLGRKFEADYLKLETDYNSGTLTPVAFEQRKQELQQQQTALQAYEEGAQKLIEAKRNELLGPILQQVEAAIKAVAEENGFLMIFDVSSGSMLYASETEDVSSMVKKKLGL